MVQPSDFMQDGAILKLVVSDSDGSLDDLLEVEEKERSLEVDFKRQVKFSEEVTYVEPPDYSDWSSYEGD